MNESEKFQLEMVTLEDLCLIAQNCKREIDKLKRDMKLFGKEDDSYPQWQQELWELERRHKYVTGRIKSRQLKMF